MVSDVLREKLTSPRYRNASAVMVWGAIFNKGCLQLVIDGAVKINGGYYKTEVLETLHAEKYFCFWQDGAQKQTAFNNGARKICQILFLKPPSLPYLNPLNFSIWHN
jgi:hypothetical protein